MNSMRKYIVIGMLCLSSFCYSQTEDMKAAKAAADAEMGMGEGFTCEKGLKDAESDFNNGKYNSYSYGFAVERKEKEGEGFNEFYKKYIREKYLINIEHKGCVTTEYSKCYSKVMEKLIYKKFGSDIYSKSRIEAVELFSKKG